MESLGLDSTIIMLPLPTFLLSQVRLELVPASGPSYFLLMAESILVQASHCSQFLRLLTWLKTTSGGAFITIERSTRTFEGSIKETMTINARNINIPIKIFLRVFI